MRLRFLPDGIRSTPCKIIGNFREKQTLKSEKFTNYKAECQDNSVIKKPKGPKTEFTYPLGY